MNHNVVNEIHTEVGAMIELGMNPHQIMFSMEHEFFYGYSVEEKTPNGLWVRFTDEYSETSTLAFLPFTEQENRHE